jgi:hypothetical protein
MHTHESLGDRDVRQHALPARSLDQPQAAHALFARRAEHLDAPTVLSLQRTAGNAGVTSLLAGDDERSPVRDVVESGGGEPLDEGTRSFMETRFDHDFGDVRVHTDSRASESARSVNAHAYTVGSNVVFRSGMYDPHSEPGQRLLAHELTHVVQQRNGPVSGAPAPGGILVSDPSDAFEQAAERTADQVMTPTSEQAAATPAAAAVQRQEAEEEESAVQAFAVQREEGEEEDSAVQTFAVQREEAEDEESA